MKLTRKADYALRLMCHLAENLGIGPVSVKDFAKREEISVKLLQSLATTLSKAGYIRTTSGRNGGAVLLKSPRDVSVLELVEAVEGQFALMVCMDEAEECQSFARCRIHQVLGEAQMKVQETLARYSLLDMVQSPNSNT